MKTINNFIIEKLKINKNSKLDKEVKSDKILSEKNNSALHGALIDMDLDKQAIFMMYDENSGTVGCFDFDDPQDLVNDYGYEETVAKKLFTMNKGETYIDKTTSAILTRIN